MTDLIKFHAISTILFDLDDTLYPQDNGVWDMVRVRIDQFLIEEMHVLPEDVLALRHRLYHQYGTTLRGLQVESAVDMDAYLEYVHDIPLEEVLKPNPALDEALNRLPHRKIIFTNANAAYARRVINALGVEHHFETIVDIYAIQPYCKPQVEAFHKALALIAEQPGNCLLVDDSRFNLDTARALGMSTLSVGAAPHSGSPHIGSILDLPAVLVP